MNFVRTNLVAWAREKAETAEENVTNMVAKITRNKTMVGIAADATWHAGDIVKKASAGAVYEDLVKLLENRPVQMGDDEVIKHLTVAYMNRLLMKAQNPAQSTNPMDTIANSGEMDAVSSIVEVLAQKDLVVGPRVESEVTVVVLNP